MVTPGSMKSHGTLCKAERLPCGWKLKGPAHVNESSGEDAEMGI